MKQGNLYVASLVRGCDAAVCQALLVRQLGGTRYRLKKAARRHLRQCVFAAQSHNPFGLFQEQGPKKEKAWQMPGCLTFRMLLPSYLASFAI
jgi:hypothetical protein